LRSTVELSFVHALLSSHRLEQRLRQQSDGEAGDDQRNQDLKQTQA